MRWLMTFLVITILGGCATNPVGGNDLTVGNVQREVHIGMSGTEVIEVLGSPNIVTTDENRNESWVYDKISTQSVETDSFGATGTLRFVDVWGPIVGTSRSKRKSTSQQTLTVIIKFDEYDKVRDFAYHASRF